MAWKPNSTTTAAAVALALAGIGRINFAHDYVLGGALILVAVVIAIRSFLYYRKRNAGES